MRKLLNRILHKQKIVDVESWDGSASNYSTAETYAKASLMNFNSGDPDTWTKNLVKLPVRRESDPSDVYVRQAVFAAAGGRGITAVTKPDGVSDEEYAKQLKSAANEIIKAYGQMDELAPESVYEIAGKDRPEQQAISFDELYYRIYEALYLIDEAMGTYTRLIDCYLTDDKNLLAVVAQNGKLYKQHFIVEGDDLMIGDFEEIPLEEDDDMPMMTGMQVIQQTDGRYRWIGIAATTALNNNGNFNSKQLYDSFIDYINETGEYPILNFYHQANTRLGITDFAARDDNLYILSGTFDDNKFGKAAAIGLQSDPGYWGQSIEFWYLDNEWYTKQVDGAMIQIPIYTQGINDATSIVPAHEAACLGTGIISQNKYGGGYSNMDEKIKGNLDKLMGEELADEFEQVADGVNQRVNESTVHQTTVEEIVEETETVEDEEEVLEVVEGVEEETIVELDETFIDDMLTDLVEHDGFQQFVDERLNGVIGGLNKQVQNLQQLVTTLQNQVTQLRTAQQATDQALQETEVEQRERWQNDLPAGNRTVVSYRPRVQVEEVVTVNGNNNGNYAEVANKTLNKILGG